MTHTTRYGKLKKTIEQGTLDSRGSPGWTLQPPQEFGSWGHILLNSGNGLVLDPGRGLGRERGSFLLVRVFFYDPGLNFGSKEIIYYTKIDCFEGHS